MIDKYKKLLVQNREIIVYLIVGILTTIVSWGAVFICEWLFLDPSIRWQNNIINTIGWVAGVLFAYPLNRKWVFKSTNPQIFKEFIQFAISRLSTWILDIVIMQVAHNDLNMDFWIAKIFISSVLVTILNYIISKILIFRKKKVKKEKEPNEK